MDFFWTALESSLLVLQNFKSLFIFFLSVLLSLLCWFLLLMSERPPLVRGLLSSCLQLLINFIQPLGFAFHLCAENSKFHIFTLALPPKVLSTVYLTFLLRSRISVSNSVYTQSWVPDLPSHFCSFPIAANPELAASTLVPLQTTLSSAHWLILLRIKSDHVFLFFPSLELGNGFLFYSEWKIPVLPVVSRASDDLAPCDHADLLLLCCSCMSSWF